MGVIKSNNKGWESNISSRCKDLNLVKESQLSLESSYSDIQLPNPSLK